MYCVKCKKTTDTLDVQFVVSRNGRNMKRGYAERQKRIIKAHLLKRRREDRC